MLQLPSRVKGPLEIGAALAEERNDDLDGFLEAAVDPVLGKSEGMRLATSVARPEPEHEASPADLIECFDIGRARPWCDPVRSSDEVWSGREALTPRNLRHNAGGNPSDALAAMPAAASTRRHPPTLPASSNHPLRRAISARRRPLASAGRAFPSGHWLEVVLLQVVRHLLAEDRALNVGRSEVDAAPHARVDDLLERHREAIEAP